MPATAAPVAAFLVRVHRAVNDGRVQIRAYALEGIRDLEWTAEDVLHQLLDLTPDDFLRIERSHAENGGTIWVFTPAHWGDGQLWIRLIERAGVVVISFHEG